MNEEKTEEEKQAVENLRLDRAIMIGCQNNLTRMPFSDLIYIRDEIQFGINTAERLENNEIKELWEKRLVVINNIIRIKLDDAMQNIDVILK